MGELTLESEYMAPYLELIEHVSLLHNVPRYWLIMPKHLFVYLINMLEDLYIVF